jgi:hypothetical protein
MKAHVGAHIEHHALGRQHQPGVARHVLLEVAEQQHGEVEPFGGIQLIADAAAAHDPQARAGEQHRDPVQQAGEGDLGPGDAHMAPYEVVQHAGGII